MTEFRIEQDYEEFAPSIEPDPDWVTTDSHGHVHYHSGDPLDPYPTLRVVDDEPWWCEQHEEPHEEGHRECKICGDAVRPGIRSPGIVRQIPTLRHYYVDDEEVTEEDFRTLMSAAKDAVPDIILPGKREKSLALGGD